MGTQLVVSAFRFRLFPTHTLMCAMNYKAGFVLRFGDYFFPLFPPQIPS